MKLDKYLLMLDRDGCLNELSTTSRYVRSIDELVLKDDAVAFLRDIKQTALKIAVVTNQQGISKNLYSYDTVSEIHNLLEIEAGYQPGSIPLYVCPHLEGTCVCRKPSPFLLEKAIKDSGVSYKNSFYLGDSENDALAARGAGIQFFSYRFTPEVNVRYFRIEEFSQLRQEILRLANN